MSYLSLTMIKTLNNVKNKKLSGNAWQGEGGGSPASCKGKLRFRSIWQMYLLSIEAPNQ